jgi:hypothetical protein
MNATPKQLALITTVIPERKIPDEGPFADAIDAFKTGETPVLSKWQASELITYLLDLPNSDKPRPPAVRIGVYVVPQVGIVRVRQVPGSRDRFSQLLDPRTRRYVDAPGVMSGIDPHHRMHAREAATWAREQGLCPWCTEVLEPARNPLQAMGPRCALKVV